jgi:hypothetical protein
VTEEIEVGLDFEVCLTKMDVDGDVKNGIGVEVAESNHPELQQIPQKWVNRKS